MPLTGGRAAIWRKRNANRGQRRRNRASPAKSTAGWPEKTPRLASGFLDATTADEVVAALRKALSSDFGAEFAVLLLFDDAAETAELNGNDWVRRVNRRDESAGGFGSLLGDESPRCGRLTEAQRDFVFGSEDGQRVASAALTPLGSPAIGMLGIGSSDADRFLPTMSVDFLSRVGDLISHAVRSRRS